MSDDWDLSDFVLWPRPGPKFIDLPPEWDETSAECLAEEEGN